MFDFNHEEFLPYQKPEQLSSVSNESAVWALMIGVILVWVRLAPELVLFGLFIIAAYRPLEEVVDVWWGVKHSPGGWRMGLFERVTFAAGLWTDCPALAEIHRAQDLRDIANGRFRT